MRLIAITVLLVSLLPGARPAHADQDVLETLREVRGAAVRVRYHLQYDGDKSPSATGFRYTCPNCGETHARNIGAEMREDRDLEVPGYLIGPDLVATADPELEPRFIERIEVVAGDEVIEATPHALALDQPALLLRLASTPTDAAPLRFREGDGPFLAVSYLEGNARWHVASRPAREIASIDDDDAAWTTIDQTGVIYSASGGPLTIRFDQVGVPGVDWRTPPSGWRTLPWTDRQRLIDDLANAGGAGVVRVTLDFRSPRQGESSMGYHRNYYGQEDSTASEWLGLGVVLDPERVLILASLSRERTARLEGVTVHLPEGDRSASFAGTLANYGAMLATLESPSERVVPLSENPIHAYRNELLLRADIDVEGRKRTAHYATFRLTAFERGWKGRVTPQMGWVRDQDDLLFDRQGRLVAVPLLRRERIQDDSYGRRSEPVLVPTPDLLAELSQLDAANLPLSEEAENRLAWLGVETQSLGAELARFHEVAGETGDGVTGALVTHVYTGSPAERAGLEVGDVLLRIHSADHREPLIIRSGYDDMDMFGGAFPWEMLDGLPEQYFDQIPPPWGSQSSPLNELLTRLGADSPYRLEYAREGELGSLELVVEWGPAHYAQASRFKHERLGITFRDLTYEVRRYFQMADDAPGVIVSVVESGSKASVGGVRPFELVTAVNGEDVHNISDVERLLEAGGLQVRLQVSRMGRGRVVNLELNE